MTTLTFAGILFHYLWGFLVLAVVLIFAENIYYSLKRVYLLIRWTILHTAKIPWTKLRSIGGLHG
jgi:hypothetical protein